MREFLPLLNKRFKGKTIKNNGYTYEFINVDIDDSLFLFTVNVILPVKGGGFVLSKIYDDIGEIVDNFFSYIGKKNTISVHVYVENKDVQSSFIPYESVAEVFELANKEYNLFRRETKNSNLVMSFEYSPLNNFSNSVQFDDGVGFIVLVNVISIKLNGVEVKPDLSSEMKESIFVSYLSDHIEQAQFENAMYDVLEPSLQFGENENLYYNAFLRINSYKGKKIKDIGVSTDWDSFSSLLEPI